MTLVVFGIIVSVVSLVIPGRSLRNAEQPSENIFKFDGTKRAERLKLIGADGKVLYEFSCEMFCSLSQITAVWNLESPIKFSASRPNLNSFVSAIANMHPKRTIALDQLTGEQYQRLLEEYGLDDASKVALSVEMSLRDGLGTYKLRIGKRTAIDSFMYVMASGPGVDSKKVYIIPDVVARAFSETLDYWRNKEIFDFRHHDIKKFSWKNFKGTQEVYREGDAWYLKGHRLADPVRVADFLTSISYNSAREFLSDSKEKDSKSLGLKPNPDLHFEFAFVDDRKPKVIDISKVQGKKYMKYLGVFQDKSYVFELDPVTAERMNILEPNAFLVETAITSDEKQRVARIDLRFSTNDLGNYVFKRPGNVWIVETQSPPLKNFVSGHIELALIRVVGAKFSAFLGKRQPPANATLLSTWKLSGAGSDVIRDFDIYQDNEGYLIHFRSGELMRLEHGLIDGVPKSGKELTR